MNALTPPGRSEFLSRLRADQFERWHAGERPRVEEYLQLHPELADSPDLLDLVCAEMVLREQAGDTPALGDYQARFPRLAGAIERQWRLHGLIRSGGLISFPTGQTDPDLATDPVYPPPPEQPPKEQPPQFPGLVLQDELGRGGMGVVYRAWQPDLDRCVAVKTVHAHLADLDQAAARFRTEARAVGRLRHPGIVQVFGFGESGGCLYLVMEYLPGGSLAGRLSGGPLPPPEAAALVAKIARAVQAAHEAGVLHRDLKPGNVLLDADGTPKVSDFGLAKLLDADADQTRDGAVLGTPAYMAPEQTIDAGRVGPAADVWALGAILHHCLAGRPPFRGDTTADLLEAIRTAAAPPPHPEGGEAPPGLAAVCAACLRKRPEDRYATAGALADDLERWLAGQAVRPPRKRRRGVTVAVTGLLAVVAASLLALWWFDPDRELRRIDRELAAGREVMLINGGPPRWHRWVAGQGGAEITQADDGAFQVHAWMFSMLELAQPTVDSYRLRAEVRHIKGSRPGQVGLYVARQQLSDGTTAAPFFLRASFDDINDVGERHDRVVKMLEEVPPDMRVRPKNRAELTTHLFLGKGWAEGGHIWSSLFDFGEFQASRGASPTWRALIVEVTPEHVRAWWGTDEGPGKVIPYGEVVNRANSQFQGLRKSLPTFPDVEVPADVPLRGGVGLIVDDGVASFRNVVLQPVPVSPPKQ